MARIYIIIAAYNEERSIANVIKDLKNNGYKNLVVVNDCSSDKTSEIARRCGATVLNHMINLGQGASLRLGTEYAIKHGADIIVHFDADGQMLASDIKYMIKPLLAKEADIVLGSRFLGKKSNVPIIRKMFLKAGIIVNILLGGIKTTDSQNGFRAMSLKAAKKIRITQDRMAHASEILSEIKRNRLRFKEVPVNIRYTAYSLYKGQSTLNAIKIFLRLVFKKIAS